MKTVIKKTVSMLLAILLLLPCFAMAEETSWICPECGQECSGSSCENCGAERPVTNDGPDSAYAVGDIVTLGSWGGEAIEWRILEDMGDGSFVLLSVKGLDTVPYHNEREAADWAGSSLRAWLNGTFFEGAFTGQEKEAVLLSTLKNADNAQYGTAGGEDTEDRVYLLSLDEVARYFQVDVYNKGGSEELICMPTEYALRNNAHTMTEEQLEGYRENYDYPLQAGACWWWLRSSGKGNSYAANVSGNSSVYADGLSVFNATTCVRPAVRVRLENLEEEAETPVYEAGEILSFGSWGGETVDWCVLEDKGDGSYILMSVKGLDAVPFHSEAGATWESSYVRAWLNDSFYAGAFTESERGQIELTHVQNPGHGVPGTADEADTEDRVFLLSLEEASTYFNTDLLHGAGSETLICMPAEKAAKNGACVLPQQTVDRLQPSYSYPLQAGACWWWLRSPGSRDGFRAAVLNDGTGYPSGIDPTVGVGCVRPVICLRPAGDGTAPVRKNGQEPAPLTPELPEPELPKPELPAPELPKPEPEVPEPETGEYKIGDIVTLGRWDNEPIEWQIMEDKGNGQFVLLSVKALDSLPLHSEDMEISWEWCSLRGWLNGSFFAAAFSEAEQATIRFTEHDGVKDKAFLLSREDLEHYYNMDPGKEAGAEALICLPTNKARDRGAIIFSKKDVDEAQDMYDYPLQLGACCWWLRGNESVEYVSCTGTVMTDRSAYSFGICARPALCAVLDAAAAADDPEEPEETFRPVVPVMPVMPSPIGPWNPGEPTEPITPTQPILPIEPIGETPTVPVDEGYAVGDTVTLGRWDRDPLDWRVLAVEDDGTYVLLLTVGLLPVPYNQSDSGADWEYCSLRRWLNSTFYNGAFSAGEKELILLSSLSNVPVPSSGIPGGNDTEDRVYLLSLQETEQYFGTDITSVGCEELICMPTRTAVISGAAELGREQLAGAQEAYSYPLREGACWWWLRTPGESAESAMRVTAFGDAESIPANSSETCIRPVIRIRFS